LWTNAHIKVRGLGPALSRGGGVTPGGGMDLRGGIRMPGVRETRPNPCLKKLINKCTGCAKIHKQTVGAKSTNLHIFIVENRGKMVPAFNITTIITRRDISSTKADVFLRFWHTKFAGHIFMN